MSNKSRGAQQPKFSEPKNPVGTVAELFAGVGGFRLGLAKAGFRTVFSNQWEPSTKRQHANEVYVHRFGAEGHTDFDIAKVLDEAEQKKRKIPNFDLLVGGFPCQDYSVAKTLNTSKGIAGKKGVLWWEILRLVQMKKPKMLLLENVDRLLKSPASNRGRDFAVMLASLSDEGYLVEWRIVNAAEYGFPQRRKRVFIVAKKLSAFPELKRIDASGYLTRSGVIARALKVDRTTGVENIREYRIEGSKGDLAYVTDHYRSDGGASWFRNSGVMVNRSVVTGDVAAVESEKATLGSVLLDKTDERLDGFWIADEKLASWEYLKGAKKIERQHASGEKYVYSEGGMAYPDLLTNPARTILTGEGGSTPSRFKHIVKIGRKHRRLAPVELERLNGFPDEWTSQGTNGPIDDSRRAFFMGNALVVGVVTKIGKVLAGDLADIR